MKLSKKAAKEIGVVLAHSLHNCKSIEAREAVLDVLGDMINEADAYLALHDGFNATLDVLEPLTIAGPRT